MNIAAGGEVHHRIGAPTGRPDQLFDLFFDRGADGRVADIGVDLHQEIAADNHRLRFWMINVGGDNRAAGCHLLAYKLRRNVFRQVRAEAVARVLLAQYFATNALATHIFPQGDELHLRRHDPLTRIVKLRNPTSRHRAARARQIIEAQMIEPFILQALLAVTGAELRQFAVAALFDPGAAQTRQALMNIDLRLGIAIRAGGIVNRHRFIGFINRIVFIAADQGRAELDLAHRHANIGTTTRNPDTFRVGKSGTLQ